MSTRTYTKNIWMCKEILINLLKKRNKLYNVLKFQKESLGQLTNYYLLIKSKILTGITH